MEVADILALAKAGFTAEQITQLAAGAQQTPAEPTPAKPTPAEPTPAKPTPAEPTPAEPTPAADETMTALKESIADLKRLIITSNIAGSNQPAAQSVDDILAQVINPPRKGDEKNGSK